MTVENRGVGRWASWTYRVGVFGLAALAAWSVLEGRMGEAALAGLCIAAAIYQPLAVLVAAAVAALLGAWIAAALGLLVAIAHFSRTLAERLPRRRPPTSDALAGALAELPEDPLYALRIRAAGEPLSTWQVVAAARAEKPGLWDPLLAKDPGPRAWDGPVLTPADRIAVTQFFAEAAGLSAEIAERNRMENNLDVFALAACMIPLSAAESWLGELDDASERVLGASLIDLISCLSEFSKQPAGSDLFPRIQIATWVQRFGPLDREFVFDLGIGKIPQLLRSLRS
jgi:hypothetical protein